MTGACGNDGKSAGMLGGGEFRASPACCARVPFAPRRGGLLETREKPGAVFNPVFWRERSWICASTEFRWRLRRSLLRIGLLPTVQYWRTLREKDSARMWSRKETDAGTPAKIFRTRREVPTSQHDPHRWLRRWCQSLGWTLAHAVVAPLQLKGIDLTRVHELPTDPHRLWLSRLVRIAASALYAAIGLYCEDRFSRNQNKTTQWSPASRGGVGWGGVACDLS